MQSVEGLIEPQQWMYRVSEAMSNLLDAALF